MPPSAIGHGKVSREVLAKYSLTEGSGSFRQSLGGGCSLGLILNLVPAVAE